MEKTDMNKFEKLEELYKRLDNLEGCEDNPIYAKEIWEIRSQISKIEVESKKDMIKSYAVIFQNEITGKVRMDIFSDASESMARKDFHDCYRHGNYNILSVTEIPEAKNYDKH